MGDDMTGPIVARLTDRVNELEVERDKARFDLDEAQRALAGAQGLIAELRARLFSVGLLLRP